MATRDDARRLLTERFDSERDAQAKEELAGHIYRMFDEGGDVGALEHLIGAGASLPEPTFRRIMRLAGTDEMPESLLDPAVMLVWQVLSTRPSAADSALPNAVISFAEKPALSDERRNALATDLFDLIPRLGGRASQHLLSQIEERNAQDRPPWREVTLRATGSEVVEVRRHAYRMVADNAIQLGVTENHSHASISDLDVQRRAEKDVAGLVRRLQSIVDRASDLGLGDAEIAALEEAIDLLRSLGGALSESHPSDRMALNHRRSVWSMFNRTGAKVGAVLVGLALFAEAATGAAVNTETLWSDIREAHALSQDLQECLDAELSEFVQVVSPEA